MDSAQWEEFGFWNGNTDASTHVYHSSMEEQERIKELKNNMERGQTNQEHRQSVDETDPQFNSSNSPTTLFENPNPMTYEGDIHNNFHEGYGYRTYEGQNEPAWNYNEGVWHTTSQWYQGQNVPYGGIELDSLMFQILDMVHQAESEGVPIQCVLVPKHMTLERLFEMRMNLGITYENSSFLETFGEILKQGIEQQIQINGSADGFCVKYLRDLHARSVTNKVQTDVKSNRQSPYMDAHTEKIPMDKSPTSDEENYEEDNDSDYNEESKAGQTLREYSPSGRTDSPYKAECERSSNRLSKSARSFLRKWLGEHINHPYPSDEEKKMFMEYTKLSIKQINNWFINARRRELPKLLKSKK